MRIFLSLVAASFIALGLWMIASGFQDPAPTSAATGPLVTGPPKSGSPVVLGTALLAGGVVFAVVLLRRR